MIIEPFLRVLGVNKVKGKKAKEIENYAIEMEKDAQVYSRLSLLLLCTLLKEKGILRM